MHQRRAEFALRLVLVAVSITALIILASTLYRLRSQGGQDAGILPTQPALVQQTISPAPDAQYEAIDVATLRAPMGFAVCVDTLPVTGNPGDRFLTTDVYYVLHRTAAVTVYERAFKDGKSWAMIEPARWVDESGLCYPDEDAP